MIDSDRSLLFCGGKSLTKWPNYEREVDAMKYSIKNSSFSNDESLPKKFETIRADVSLAMVKIK